MVLHNIFPEVKIVDYSFYLFVLLLLGTMLFLSIAYRVWKSRTKSVGYYLDIIESSLFIDAKQTVYKLEYYGNFIATTPQQKEKLTTLIERFKPFKYLPDGTLFTKEAQETLTHFLNQIRQENV